MEDRGNTEVRNWRAEDKQRRLNIGHYQGAASSPMIRQGDHHRSNFRGNTKLLGVKDKGRSSNQGGHSPEKSGKLEETVARRGTAGIKQWKPSGKEG